MSYNAKTSNIRNIYMSDTRIESINSHLADEKREKEAKKDENVWNKRGYKRINDFEEIKAFFGETLATNLIRNVEENNLLLLVKEDSLVHRVFENDEDREKILDSMSNSEEKALIREVMNVYKKRTCPINVDGVWCNFETTTNGKVPLFDKEWNIIHKEVKSEKVIDNLKSVQVAVAVKPVFVDIDIDSVPVCVIEPILKCLRFEEEERKKQISTKRNLTKK